MSVVCLQVVDGEPSFEQVIEPHFEGQTDAELLVAKAAGAADKDWDVEWLDDATFVARKVRWLEEALCERIFRLE